MLGNRTCIKIVISCLNLYMNTADAKYRPTLVQREKRISFSFQQGKGSLPEARQPGYANGGR